MILLSLSLPTPPSNVLLTFIPITYFSHSSNLLDEHTIAATQLTSFLNPVLFTKKINPLYLLKIYTIQLNML